MNCQKKTLPESPDDERLHNQFTAYLIISLRRRKIKYLIKKSREKRMVTSLDELLERQGEAEEPALATYFDELEYFVGTLEDIICNDRLLVAILKLSDRERKILNLRLVHKLKHAEIAAILGLRRNTVEKCYSRIIQKLRSYMEGGLDDEGI